MPLTILYKLKQKKTIITMFSFLVAFISIFIFLGYFYGNHVALSDEQGSIIATGTVDARTVQLAFKIPGKIEKLNVSEGDRVEKGQLLASLETKELEAKVLQAQGAYEAALKQSEQAHTGIALTSQTIAAKIQQAQAIADKAQVGLDDAKQQYERIEKLYEAGAVSIQQLDKAKNAYNAAKNDLQAAQGNLEEAYSARINVSVTESQAGAASSHAKQAQGALMEAETYFQDAYLKSTLNGFITQKLLEEGEMVNAGTPVFEITDLANTYIKVYVDETKIGRVKLNQTAEIRLDAFPNRTFTGKVVWINNAGDFAVHKAVNEQYSHDIRSFEVKISVPNKDMLLKTGMTATVKIVEGK